MNITILSLSSDIRKREIAQALMFYQASCALLSLPLEHSQIQNLSSETVVLLLDTESRSAPMVLQDLRRHAPSSPVLVISAAQSRDYSARLFAYGATVVLPPKSELESICAEIRAVHLIRRHGSDEPLLKSLQPFIAAAIESFEMMASVNVTLDRIAHCGHSVMPGSVSAIIYLIGNRERVLTISCSDLVAHAFARRMLHDAVNDLDPFMVDDAIGEILNIMAGLARSRQCADPDNKFDITTPTVVRGENHRFSFREDLPGLEMNFSSPCGSFAVRLGHRAWET